MELFWPGKALGAVVSVYPDAGFFGVDLTLPIAANPTTRAVSDVLGAGHWANHPG